MYSKDAFNVYYNGRVVNGAFVHNFEILDEEYAKDPFNVYYRGNVLQGASPHTFTIPSSPRGRRRTISPRRRRNFYDENECNFSSDVESVTISRDGILEGFLTSGRRKRVRIDSNNYLGNDNGRFDLNGKNFSDTSKNLRVVYRGCRLSGELQDKNGKWNYDNINLDDVLHIKDREIRFKRRGRNYPRVGIGASNRNGELNLECNIL